jgi:hypothetical protein
MEKNDVKSLLPFLLIGILTGIVCAVFYVLVGSTLGFRGIFLTALIAILGGLVIVLVNAHQNNKQR